MSWSGIRHLTQFADRWPSRAHSSVSRSRRVVRGSLTGDSGPFLLVESRCTLGLDSIFALDSDAAKWDRRWEAQKACRCRVYRLGRGGHHCYGRFLIDFRRLTSGESHIAVEKFRRRAVAIHRSANTTALNRRFVDHCRSRR